jgi:RNA polymerase sigma-70 factor (ECF subfamily)
MAAAMTAARKDRRHEDVEVVAAGCGNRSTGGGAGWEFLGYRGLLVPLLSLRRQTLDRVDSTERASLHRAMTRLASGDRSAFHPVFDRLWPCLRRFAGRHLPAPDADDIAQQALLKVFERAGEFDQRLDALSWALGITAYEIRSVRNRMSRRREEPPTPLIAHADGRPSPEEELITADLVLAVTETIGGLRPADVETLTLLVRGERHTGATFRKRLERGLNRFKLAWRIRHGSG